MHDKWIWCGELEQEQENESENEGGHVLGREIEMSGMGWEVGFDAQRRKMKARESDEHRTPGSCWDRDRKH